MDCREFRKTLDADPGAEFDGRAEHMADCASCARYAAQALVFERRLASALAVDVPDFEIGLPDDDGEEKGEEKVVSLDRHHRGRPRRWRGVPVWVGVAATLVLGIGIVLQFGEDVADPAPTVLAAEVIAHMAHEPESRVITSDAIGSDALSRVLAPAVSRLDSDRVGLITYARTCPINGREVPHLVVQGADGPVTLLLMAGEKLERPLPLDGNGFHGVILPVGNGSIAVIAEQDHSVEDVTESIRDAVDWSI